MASRVIQLHKEFNELIPFLFPNYKSVEEPSLLDAGKKLLIFMNRRKYRTIEQLESRLNSLTSNYIIITDLKDEKSVDLVDKESMTQFIICEFSMPAYKYLSRVGKMSNKDFVEFAKESIVLRKWATRFFESEDKIFLVFDAYSESKESFHRELLKVMDGDADGIVLSSLFTFLLRVKNYETQKNLLSDRYRETVRKALAQKVSPKRFVNSLITMDDGIPLALRVMASME